MKPKKVSAKTKMAECLVFAIESFKNKPVANFDSGDRMEGWHQWFVRVLNEAGYDVKLRKEK
jgi:hypothetical protein